MVTTRRLRCKRRNLLLILCVLSVVSLVTLISAKARRTSRKSPHTHVLYDVINKTDVLLTDFIHQISDRRKQIVAAPPRRIYGWEEKYFEKLSSETEVQTYKLEGKFESVKQLYFSRYFRWTATKSACARIQNFAEAESDQLFMNSMCYSDLNKAFDRVNFNILFVDSGPPFDLKGKNKQLKNDDILVTYIHFIRNSVVLPGGNVQTGDVIISPRGCTENIETNGKARKKTVASVDEVFVISQYWAENYFHSLVETLPRIAPFVDFLRQNPSIRIHTEPTPYISNALEMFDISSPRMISGKVRAKVIYLPEGVRCAHAQIYNTQLLAQMFLNRMDMLFPNDNRNVIILIKRSAKRFFRRHLSVLESLKKLAEETNNKLVVFDDRDLPKFSETVRLFHKAKMVVGIHGAGFSNIIFSQPGTFVIEALCFQPHANLCFRRLAHILGHHYHAVASKESCLDITPEDIIPSVRYFLTHRE